MRCEDVIRELAAPTGLPGSAPMAEHLAGCPRCASVAELGTRLDRLWEATRPPELSAAAWDRIWGNVSDAFDRRAVPAASPPSRPVPAAPSRWHRSATAAFVLAQAAAILLAGSVLLLSRGPGSGPPGRRSSPLAASASAVPTRKVEIDQQQVVLISFAGPDIHVRDLALNESPYAVDPFYAMYNAVESLALQ